MHEQIENEYIIGLLQQRCCTVHNVHSDNKLSEMLTLLEKGLHNVKVLRVFIYLHFKSCFLEHFLCDHLLIHLFVISAKLITEPKSFFQKVMNALIINLIVYIRSFAHQHQGNFCDPVIRKEELFKATGKPRMK